MAQADLTKLLRKYIKFKLVCDDITWRGSPLVRDRIAELIRKTVQNGEAHSALIIGPRGCGKTTLVSSVLSELEDELNLEEDAIVVQLNGLIHNDDKLALQAITAQMQLENAVGDRVFGTVAENLSFLLSCMVSGGRACRSMVFIMDEFHAFCRPGLAQTLIYNLFDLTHAGRAPVCVLGITSRLDVMELLEKRVKSRFSHNHIFVFPNEAENGENTSPVEYFLTLFVELLSLPYFNKNKKKSKRKSQIEIIESEQRFALPEKVLHKCQTDVKQFEKLDTDFACEWNAHIKAMAEDSIVVDAIEKFCYYTVNEQVFRDMLLQVVSTSLCDRDALVAAIDACVCGDLRLQHIQSLSVLQVSLLIAMLHAADVLDSQPINFEMVLHRYSKFANTNSSAQSVPRPVILKAFEHLHALEIIVPVRTTDGATHTGTSRVQKEYQLYTLAVSKQDVHEALAGYKALPTEIMHWLNNAVV